MRASKTAPMASALVVLIAAGLVGSTQNVFSRRSKAFYAEQAVIAFVRPGLIADIQSAEIGQDGTIRARVKFTDPRGLPLELEGITTPGPISGGRPGMIAAYLPPGSDDYNTYTNRTVQSPITNVSAVQSAADSGGTWRSVSGEEGLYEYTFGTRAPAGYDANARHAIGVYANRDLSEFDLGVYLDDDAYHFIPASGETVPGPEDVIDTSVCNSCHGFLTAHGETGRISMEVCVLCHNQETVDPDTGHTMDMEVMTHKIHYGAQLPSVRAGEPYQIIGFGQSVHDYSHVEFPADTRRCQTCHQSGTATMKHQENVTPENDWLTSPSRAACGSCHDDVNFATGHGHVNLPQISDAQCSTCHRPQGELEFDASILGAHTIPTESSMLRGVQYELVRVDNTAPGQRPTVTFRLLDKQNNPVDLSTMQRLALVMAGPLKGYTAFSEGYVTEEVLGNVSGSNGLYTYTFRTPVPQDANGTFAIGIEGRTQEVLLEGTVKEMNVRASPPNKVTYFAVGNQPLQRRREIVSIEKCNGCHGQLVVHGANRNRIEQCVLCHNPKETDAARRPAAEMPAETVNMRFMIHRIHGAEYAAEQGGRPYVVYGFGGTAHDFSEVGYPAPLTACSMCHIEDTESLPLPEGLQPVVNPRGLLNPLPPATSACVSCHASRAAKAHALANTTAIGESCAACHGQNSEFSVHKAHAQTEGF